MGRRTYDPALAAGITNPYPHLRQYIVSRNLQSDDSAVAVVREDPAAAVDALKREDSPLDVYLAGGGDLAAQLLPQIDQLVVKSYPVVAGAGKPVFGNAFSPTHFELDDVKTFSGGNAVLTYSRK
jgi:dihydrofolate reductase